VKVTIVAVGSELLRPGRPETHSERITGLLRTIGLEVESRLVVPDRRERIVEAVREARRRPRLTLVTGGIGPTRDDLTREAVSEALGRPLVTDRRAEAALRGWCRRHGIPFTRYQARQAGIPQGARRVANRVGSAAGFEYSDRRGVVLVLPGVFGELWPMLTRRLPRLRRLAGGRLVAAALRTAGRGEARVDRIIAPIVRRFPEVEVTTLAAPGEVVIQLGAQGDRAAGNVAACRAALVRKLGEDLVSAEGESLESVVLRHLRKRRMRIAVAESCTAGLVCARLASVPGASRALAAGAVCYNDRAKQRILSIPGSALRRHGAVSRWTALAMARGVAALAESGVGVAVTGIAGPAGGTPRTPVGTVHWAVVGPDGFSAGHRLLPGDREKVRVHSASIALDQVRRFLISTGRAARRKWR
jgi:competence/damage-inducible protein CinA-like protein